MSSMESQLRARRVRSLHSLRTSRTSSKPGGKGKKLPFLQDTCYRCGKGRHQKTQDCKALDAVCRGCGKKGHFEEVCLKAKCSTHSLEVPQVSTSSAGAGASEPLYFDDDGQPIFAHMVSVLHENKHLIKFPIALDYMTLRSRGSREGWNKMENSTDSTVHPQQTVAQGRHRSQCELHEDKHLINYLARPRCYN